MKKTTYTHKTPLNKHPSKIILCFISHESILNTSSIYSPQHTTLQNTLYSVHKYFKKEIQVRQTALIDFPLTKQKLTHTLIHRKNGTPSTFPPQSLFYQLHCCLSGHNIYKKYSEDKNKNNEMQKEEIIHPALKIKLLTKMKRQYSKK